jgi:hypothetical protein
MKKIIFIVIVLFSVSSQAQVLQKNTAYGWSWLRGGFDSVLQIPKDTLSGGKRIAQSGKDTGQLRYNRADSSVYVHTGTKWINVAGSGSGATPNLAGVTAVGNTTSLDIIASTGASNSATLKASGELALQKSDDYLLITPALIAFTKLISGKAVKIFPNTASGTIDDNFILPDKGGVTDTFAFKSDINSIASAKLNISDTAAMMKRDTSSVFLLADATTSSTTAVATNLKFQIAANQRYFVMIDGTASKATSSSGMRLAVGAPSGCTIKGYSQQGTATLSTAMTNSLITAINTLGSTFATGIGVEVPFRMVFTVTNGANAGVVELQFATVTSDTATIYAGTNMRWQKTKGL